MMDHVLEVAIAAAQALFFFGVLWGRFKKLETQNEKQESRLQAVEMTAIPNGMERVRQLELEGVRSNARTGALEQDIEALAGADRDLRAALDRKLSSSAMKAIRIPRTDTESSDPPPMEPPRPRLPSRPR